MPCLRFKSFLPFQPAQHRHRIALHRILVVPSAHSIPSGLYPAPIPTSSNHRRLRLRQGPSFRSGGPAPAPDEHSSESIHPSNQHPKSNPSPGKPASRRLELRSIPFSRSPSPAHRFNRWPINPPFSSGPPPPFLPYNQPSVGFPHPPTTPFVFISTSCVRGRLSTVKISYALNIHRARGLQP
jgi:hypothetical protein